MAKQLLAGITGGIGSGKSTIAKILASYGFPVYDSDLQAKLLMENNKTIAKDLIETFGSEVFTNGKLNKQFLSNQIFLSPSKMKKVNSIVHYAVIEDFKDWAKTQNSKIVFLESAIIFENNLEKFFDKIISVVSPKKLRIKRIKERSNLSTKEIESRIKSQISDRKLKQRADFIIKNNDRSAIIPQIETILEQLIDNSKQN